MNSAKHNGCAVNGRGGVLVECVLALPMALLLVWLVLWCGIRCTEKLVATYAMFMGIRAAIVATAPLSAGIKVHQTATAIFPRVLQWQSLHAPWRLGHVRAPLGHAAPTGDNPIP